MKVKRVMKILPLIPGDGIQVAVEHEQQMELESDEYDTSSSSSSSSESSSETNSESETDSDDHHRHHKSRGRSKIKKKYKRTTKSSRRERNDWAETNRNVDLMHSNPQLMEMVQSLVDERLSAMGKDTTGKRVNIPQTPTRIDTNNRQLRSPSDITQYVPALARLTSPIINKDLTPSKANEQAALECRLNRLRMGTIDDEMISGGNGTAEEEPKEVSMDPETIRIQAARTAAENAVIQAEKFKADATVIDKGRVPELGRYDYHLEFIHVTSHLEDVVLQKIRKGEFLELEKLLNKAMNPLKTDAEGKMDLVNHDGHTYFVPSSDKDHRINNIKQWERAFRIYIMIYSEANPTQTSEILQYLDIIMEASQTFVWANIAQYDYSFRKLMHLQANRSWGRVHTQLWATNMKQHHPGGRNQAFGQNQNSSKPNWREISCWHYNQNKCNRTAAQCRFEHRCSFCGSFSHIMIHCPKRSNKKSDKTTDTKKESAPATSVTAGSSTA